MAPGAIERSTYRLAADAGAVGVAVAVYAPAHRQIGDLPHTLHCFDRPVAGLAADPRRRVGPMIEVSEVGKVMHLDPRNRPLRLGRIALQITIQPERVVELAQL